MRDKELLAAFQTADAPAAFLTTLRAGQLRRLCRFYRLNLTNAGRFYRRDENIQRLTEVELLRRNGQ